MKVPCIYYSLSNEELDVIKVWLDYFIKEEVEYFSLSSYRLRDLLKNKPAILFSIGTRIQNELNDELKALSPSTIHYTLPHPSCLTKEDKNNETRVNTQKLLEEAKLSIDSLKYFWVGKNMSQNDLPDFSIETLKELKEYLESSKEDFILTGNRNGQVIKVSSRPEIGKKENAVFSITISNLIAIKTAIEILGLKEFYFEPIERI